MPRLFPASVVLLVTALTACDAKLPEPDSPAAQLYARRCGSGCHRVYAPGSMKYEMWRITMERMRREYPAKGLPPLTSAEEELILDYLRRHAG